MCIRIGATPLIERSIQELGYLELVSCSSSPSNPFMNMHTTVLTPMSASLWVQLFMMVIRKTNALHNTGEKFLQVSGMCASRKLHQSEVRYWYKQRVSSSLRSKAQTAI